MKIILDTNEYIFGLDGESGEEASVKLLNVVRLMIEDIKDFKLLLPEIIREEVQRNIPEYLKKDFHKLIYSSEKIEHHPMLNVPFKLFDKYRNEMGLKEGDAMIAAFAEFMKVNYLVSENRHIYKNLKIKEFVTINASEFLKILEEIKYLH